MSATYTCPNPACGATLRTANPVPAGRPVNCPKCKQTFTPVPDGGEPPAAGPGTFKFADDEPKKPAKPKANITGSPKGKGEKPPEMPKPEEKKKRFEEEEEDDESIKKGYGVVKETEAEAAAAEKNKPKFEDIQEKFKKSARGPAIALLVTPANLLIVEGLITGVAGIALAIIGMWPLVFNDAPASEEETEEAVITMLLGLMTFGWGGIICLGASMMQELRSYTWAMIGAVMGVLPLLVGIYAILMLQNPKVKAGFEESEGGPEDDDEDEDKDEDEDDEDDDDD
jgi:cadmium resistance protein CadD (predicted permease)